jgi:DnaJ-class molecular chaperone
MGRDYYEILGIDKNADDKTIKKAYKTLANKVHPDKNPNNIEEATEKFKEVTAAYEVLSNPDKRKIYDEHGEEGLKHAGSADMSDNPFNDFMKHMFNMAPEQNNTIEIPDIEIDYELTLEEMFTGIKVKKNITRKNLCNDCEGTGFADKKEHKCSNCQGQGKSVRIQRMGPMVQQIIEPCRPCQGRGIDRNINPCNKCHGKTTLSEDHELDFAIPAGSFGGLTLVSQNRGNEIPHKYRKGQERSNVKITLKMKNHNTYNRMFIIENKKHVANPADLLHEINILLVESLCGVNRTIKYLDGTDIKITCNKIIKDGTIMILQGKGMPIINSTEKGDLYIKFNVLYPCEISLESKKKIWNALSNTNIEIPQENNLINLEDINLNAKSDDYKKFNQHNQHNQSHQNNHFNQRQNNRGNFFSTFNFGPGFNPFN